MRNASTTMHAVDFIAIAREFMALHAGCCRWDAGVIMLAVFLFCFASWSENLEGFRQYLSEQAKCKELFTNTYPLLVFEAHTAGRIFCQTTTHFISFN